jgi:hypothetical protein
MHTVMTSFEVLSRYIPEKTEEDHETPEDLSLSGCYILSLGKQVPTFQGS